MSIREDGERGWGNKEVKYGIAIQWNIIWQLKGINY